MTRKRRRFVFVLIGVAMLSVATALVLFAFNKNIVFFYSPTDLLASAVGEVTQRFRALIEERADATTSLRKCFSAAISRLDVLLVHIFLKLGHTIPME